MITSKVESRPTTYQVVGPPNYDVSEIEMSVSVDRKNMTI